LNVVIWILAGALLGSAANLVLGTRNRAGIALDVAIGIAGVLSGGWLLSVLARTSAFADGEFSTASLLISLMGATALLAALQVLRGRSPREAATRPGDEAPALAIAVRATTTKMREPT
jgi:uncharacterized membrane protein YeaQ/YmgE (transglycosylase-associated protein family)